MIKKFIQKMLDIHPNAISFEETLNLTGLPIISMKQWDEKEQQDKVFNFILDTGSDVNVIDDNILDQLNYEVLKAKGTVYGVDGKRVKTKVLNITFSHKDRDYPYVWLARDMSEPFGNMKKDYGVNLHGIIGSRFFNEYKYILDFKDLKAYSKA